MSTRSIDRALSMLPALVSLGMQQRQLESAEAERERLAAMRMVGMEHEAAQRDYIAQLAGQSVTPELIMEATSKGPKAAEAARTLYGLQQAQQQQEVAEFNRRLAQEEARERRDVMALMAPEVGARLAQSDRPELQVLGDLLQMAGEAGPTGVETLGALTGFIPKPGAVSYQYGIYPGQDKGRGQEVSLRNLYAALAKLASVDQSVLPQLNVIGAQLGLPPVGGDRQGTAQPPKEEPGWWDVLWGGAEGAQKAEPGAAPAPRRTPTPAPGARRGAAPVGQAALGVPAAATPPTTDEGSALGDMAQLMKFAAPPGMGVVLDILGAIESVRGVPPTEPAPPPLPPVTREPALFEPVERPYVLQREVPGAFYYGLPAGE